MDSFGTIIIILLGAMGCAWIIAKPASDKADELEKKLKDFTAEIEKQKLLTSANFHLANNRMDGIEKDFADKYSLLREKQIELKEILSNKRPVIKMADPALIKKLQKQFNDLAKVPNGPPKSN